MKTYDYDELMFELVDSLEARLPWRVKKKEYDPQYKGYNNTDGYVRSYWQEVKNRIDFLFDGCTLIRANDNRKHFDAHFNNRRNATDFAEQVMRFTKVFYKYEVEKPADVEEDDDYHIVRLYSFTEEELPGGGKMFGFH